MNTSGPVFSIDGELSIYRAAELAEALQSWLACHQSHAALQLDLRHVSEIDSAGLQLLLSLQRTAQAQAIALQIHPVSPAVQDVLALTSLEHLLATTAPAKAP